MVLRKSTGSVTTVSRQTSRDQDWDACLDMLAADSSVRAPLGTDNKHAMSSTEAGHDRVLRRRQTQKCFRQRRKERNLAVQSLLWYTQERLKQSELDIFALKARCKVLEGILFRQGSISEFDGLQHSGTEQHIPDVLRNMLFPAVKLMSWTDTPYSMTSHDICHLPQEAFAGLYTAAVKEMQRVLSAMTSSANSSCEGHELLKSSVIQAISLAVSIILRDSTRLTETTSLRTSAGSLSAVVCHPYSREALVNMAFSRGQVQDLLTLRQLFYARTGQLSLERHVLMSKMSRHSQQALNVKTWAKRLQENSEEEQQMALLMLTATCFGVHTVQQNALCMIAAYPNILSTNIHEALAEQWAQPLMSDIMRQQSLPEGATLWEDVSTYVQSIDVYNMFHCMPFVSSCTTTVHEIPSE